MSSCYGCTQLIPGSNYECLPLIGQIGCTECGVSWFPDKGRKDGEPLKLNCPKCGERPPVAFIEVIPGGLERSPFCPGYKRSETLF